MGYIKLTPFSGFVFKKESLKKVSLPLSKLQELLELEIEEDSEDLVSFKSCFPDRTQYLIEELKKVNLEYVDDYFVFEVDIPEWLSFGVFKV